MNQEKESLSGAVGMLFDFATLKYPATCLASSSVQNLHLIPKSRTDRLDENRAIGCDNRQQPSNVSAWIASWWI